MRYEHPLIASLLIGVTQEADLVSPGFEQSTAISNHSTLDFTLHYGDQRTVLPGGASWKRLCSSSVPPDDDDDVYSGNLADFAVKILINFRHISLNLGGQVF